MSLAGFDFQRLNRLCLSSFNQPLNLAADYGVSVVKATSTGTVWRCIGIFHLSPQENNGRHNCYIECLDENGNRTYAPKIAWTWWIDGPVQLKTLDKPADEPAADIPIDKNATLTIRVDGGVSDSVGNIHTRHADEPPGTSWGHHSYYLVFQRQQNGVVVPPTEPPTEPPVSNAALAQLARVRQELDVLEGMLQ